MKYSRMGRKVKNRRREQNKKGWASSVGLYQKTQTLTFPPREGELAGTTRVRTFRWAKRRSKEPFLFQLYCYPDERSLSFKRKTTSCRNK